jgi:hypothetical protein
MSINSIKQKVTQISSKQIALLALGFCIILAILITLAFRRQNQGTLAAIPTDVQLAARVDLAARSYDGETVAQLTLAETAVVHIYYMLPNIDLTYFDLSLKGADGDTHLILHSEDYQTDENGGGEWEKHLSQGVYQLVLTAPQTTGTLSVYWTSK